MLLDTVIQLKRIDPRIRELRRLIGRAKSARRVKIIRPYLEAYLAERDRLLFKTL